MTLKEKIQEDVKDSVKQKEELRSSVLRLLSAAILNKEKEKRYKLGQEKEVQLTDEEIVDVISSEAKKRKEAMEGYQKGGREDSVKKEKEELAILQQYLPEQLSEEEIKKLVKAAIEKTEAVSPKDMGKVMAELTPKIKGRAEGELVSRIVKELIISK